MISETAHSSLPECYVFATDYLEQSRQSRKSLCRLACFLVPVFAVIVSGCGNGRNRSELELPAALRSDFPYTLTTSENWSWEANSFECRLDGLMHRFVSKGISTPGRGDPLFQNAVDQYRELISQSPVRCVVVERDEFHREVAFTFARQEKEVTDNQGPEQTEEVVVSIKPTDGEFDVGLRMIELGLAKHDGTDFDGSEAYRAAESNARRAKLGIWR